MAAASWEGVEGCCQKLSMSPSARYTARSLVVLALVSNLCSSHCDGERVEESGTGRLELNLDAQMKLRDDYIKTLESRISRLETALDRSDLSASSNDRHGASEMVSEGAVARDGAEARVSDTRAFGDMESRARETDVWKKARDGLRAVQSSGARAELAANGLAEHRVRQGAADGTDNCKYSERLNKLEKNIQSVNVTKMQQDVVRMLEMHGFDAGNTAWIILSSAMVLMMTIPGLALFYGGLVRVQNVLSTVMQSFSIACMITVEWILLGYSLSSTNGGYFFGGTSRVWLRGLTMESRHASMPTVPEAIYCMYMLMFAIITPSLVVNVTFSPVCAMSSAPNAAIHSSAVIA